MDFSLLHHLRSGIWYLGLSGWSFGICDRTVAGLGDGYLSAVDLIQLFTAAFFAVLWLFLKPGGKSWSL